MASEIEACGRCGRAKAVHLEERDRCRAHITPETTNAQFLAFVTFGAKADCDRATIARLERELAEAKGRAAELEAGVRELGKCTHCDGDGANRQPNYGRLRGVEVLTKCRHCVGGVRPLAKDLLATSPAG